MIEYVGPLGSFIVILIAFYNQYVSWSIVLAGLVALIIFVIWLGWKYVANTRKLNGSIEDKAG